MIEYNLFSAAPVIPLPPRVTTIPKTPEDKAAKSIQDGYRNFKAVKEASGNVQITVYEAKDLIPGDSDTGWFF